mgnify:CR=1 FL=1
MKGNRQGSLSRSITRRSDQNCKIILQILILQFCRQLVKKVLLDFFDKLRKITFFAAEQGGRAVGMCSVSRCWSTFSCGWTAALEDFYVEPAFRKKGIARLLAGAAQRWCAEQGIASLTVCCAPCDEGMYRALGFSEPLGRTLACLP